MCLYITHVNSQELPALSQEMAPFRHHLLRISPPVLTGNLVILWYLWELFLEEVILWKHLTCFFCLPELVLASNVCLGFGFLCCFSVLFGALGGLVGFFVCLFFSVVGFFSPFSLAATASLEPTVWEFLFCKPLSLQLKWLWRVKLEKVMQTIQIKTMKSCTTEDHCMHLPVALWKTVINVCCVWACVYAQNGQGGKLFLLTSWLFTFNEN